MVSCLLCKKNTIIKGKNRKEMGLSASSLRLAMLTARKSSLEFEGQQINQQRLSLSNQTAALFNAMLTMQVPTPPDPTEFSKMVYTFKAEPRIGRFLNGFGDETHKTSKNFGVFQVGAMTYSFVKSAS